MKIWKYRIFVNDVVQTVQVPGADEAKVVAARVSEFHDIIEVWIEVHPGQLIGVLEFRVFGTGHEIETTSNRQTIHTGTVFDEVLGLVWHVYQLHEVPA